jgi:hypothetical protein
MLPSPEPAYLAIADISGYTGYVAGVELDHAQDILADLMSRVVKTLRPPFKLAKLEGDAAFVHAASLVDGALLQDAIESTYFAFRRRQRDIARATSCECDACRRIPQLDLKFVVHHGTIAKQKMAGRAELVGRDVILIHRLLKNSVEEKLQERAYALYTDACVRAAGIDPKSQGFIEHSETIDIIGTVKAWLKDLSAAWAEEEARQRVEVLPADTLIFIAHDVPTPRQTTWEYATVPGRRAEWQADKVIEVENPRKGRRGAGAVNHCVHGEDTIVEEVLDWRPPDYFTAYYQVPMPGLPKLLMTDTFIELPDGRTRIESRVTAANAKDRETLTAMLPMVEEMLKHVSESLARRLEEVAKAPAEASDEPPLPEARMRFS